MNEIILQFFSNFHTITPLQKSVNIMLAQRSAANPQILGAKSFEVVASEALISPPNYYPAYLNPSVKSIEIKLVLFHQPPSSKYALENYPFASLKGVIWMIEEQGNFILWRLLIIGQPPHTTGVPLAKEESRSCFVLLRTQAQSINTQDRHLPERKSLKLLYFKI